jgi:DNA-binding beta-propeller fold protein YncE
MRAVTKNWIWFIGLMGLVLLGGVWLGQSRRPEPGRSLTYDLAPFLQVDPTLIRYEELAPIRPTVSGLKALALGADGALFVAGAEGVEEVASKKRLLSGKAVQCLALDAEGRLYAGGMDRIWVVESDVWVRTIEVPGEQPFVTSLAVDEHSVFVADAGNRTVWRLDVVSGERVQEPLTGFVVPSPFFDLALSEEGMLWVVNPGKHQFVQFTKEGERVSAWERTSMGIDGFSGCCNPSHMAIRPDGSFVTTEKGLPRVKVHGDDGTLIAVVAAPEAFDAKVSGLDLAVGKEGRIYLLDPSAGLVRVFEEKE